MAKSKTAGAGSHEKVQALSQMIKDLERQLDQLLEINEAVEKFSTIKALQAIERAHVVVLMLDAREGLTDQDTTLLGHILTEGRALVIALNKWDGLDADHRKRVRAELDRKLSYVNWARRVTLSALHGSGIQELPTGPSPRTGQTYSSSPTGTARPGTSRW